MKIEEVIKQIKTGNHLEEKDVKKAITELRIIIAYLKLRLTYFK